MNNIRAKFEEIWLVPDGVEWDDSRGEYMPKDLSSEYHLDAAVEHDARLDTFTRCQETTDVYVSIIDEMVKNMTLINETTTDVRSGGIAIESIGRAKQKLEQIK